MDALTTAQTAIDLTSEWFPRTVDESRLNPAELALAGFARCRRLLQGVVNMFEAPDLSGILARSLYETWLSCAYLILKKGEAIERLKANDERAARKMAKRLIDEFGDDDAAAELIAQSQATLEQAEPSIGVLHVTSIAAKVHHAYEAENVADPFTTRAYAALYGPESYAAVHGGLGALKMHIRAGQIISGPWQHSANERRLLICASMVTTMGLELANELDLPADDLRDFASWLRPPAEE